MARGRKKSKKSLPVPKIFIRGRSGRYYFRMRMDDKDTWISTKSSDYATAAKIAESAVHAQITAGTLASTEKRTGEIGRKIGDSMVAEVTGKKTVKIKLDEAHDKWAGLTASFNRISSPTQAFYRSVFKKFSDWCQEKGTAYIDSVDREKASKYSAFLRDSKITGKTYNEHLNHLSRVFHHLDLIYNLPHRNPFDRKHVQRVGRSEMDSQGHQALEPDDMKAVIAEAAKRGQDFLDLFIIGSQTGMRLKDAALLDWSEIHGDFIEIVPEKTRRTSNRARIPISDVLSEVLGRRRGQDGSGTYVVPAIAGHYLRNAQYVIKTSKKIFEDALGKERTQTACGEHRKLNTSVLSFHSFRTTFMSLLASKDVSVRDAMRMMGWESPHMIRVYERELEKTKGDADSRARRLIASISELGYDVPDAAKEEGLPRTPEILSGLVSRYSNRAIGRIYGVSDVAVKKWLDRLGIRRTRRIESPDISEGVIGRIRKEMLSSAAGRQ